MAELKTRKTTASVNDFIASIDDETRRADAVTVCKLMQKVSKTPPAMWGTAIIGFGSRKLVYASGRELDWPLIAFSPRKQNTVLYIMNGFANYDALLSRLGKHKTGKACLYINALADVDLNVLKELVSASVAAAKKN